MREAIAHSNRLKAVFDVLLLLGYLVFIYWLSAHPKLPAPMFFSWQDKLYHAGAYFVMGLLAWRCCRHVSADRRIQLLASVAFCCLYGLSDEWHQYYVPGRSSSIGDWLADTIGAAISIGALKLQAIPKRLLD
jgi:VanZ family protein